MAGMVVPSSLERGQMLSKWNTAVARWIKSTTGPGGYPTWPPTMPLPRTTSRRPLPPIEDGLALRDVRAGVRKLKDHAPRR
jgi:hypothetical protein